MKYEPTTSLDDLDVKIQIRLCIVRFIVALKNKVNLSINENSNEFQEKCPFGFWVAT